MMTMTVTLTYKDVTEAVSCLVTVALTSLDISRNCMRRSPSQGLNGRPHSHTSPDSVQKLQDIAGRVDLYYQHHRTGRPRPAQSCMAAGSCRSLTVLSPVHPSLVGVHGSRAARRCISIPLHDVIYSLSNPDPVIPYPVDGRMRNGCRPCRRACMMNSPL